MVNEKRLIDVNALIASGYEVTLDKVFPDWAELPDATKEAVCKHGQYLKKMINELPTVDAVEVDTVIEMFEYMLGDCPCNFSPVDEWLAERCELQEECPKPGDKHGCWKQFIKHFCAKMDGDGNG